jgi:protein TonB
VSSSLASIPDSPFAPPSFRPALGPALRKSIVLHGVLLGFGLVFFLVDDLLNPAREIQIPLSLELKTETAPRPATRAPQIKSSSNPLSAPAPGIPENSSDAPATGEAALENQEAIAGAAKASYLSELRAFIESNKFYPPQARTLGHEGRTEVKFTVLADGTLASIELIRSSGSKLLDQAALALLTRVEKLRPIPESLQISRFDLVLPIEYMLD